MIGRRIALLLGGLFVGLLLAEGFARVRTPTGVEGMLFDAPGAMPSDMYQGDPVLFQVPVPGWRGTARSLGYEVEIGFNSLGLRGPEPGQAETRILLLGDSFALAAQVREEFTLAARLEGLTDSEVFNAGVDGYSTWQATGRYQRLADRLQPDHVVLLFFLGNDLADNERFPMTQGQQYSPTVHHRESSWLTRHSYLLGSIRVALRYARLRSRPQDPEVQRYHRELAIYSSSGSSILEAQLSFTRQALSQLAQETRKRGDSLLVALVPPAFHVTPDRMSTTFELAGIDPATVSLERPGRAVHEILDQLSIPSCPLESTLLEAGPETYLQFDGHWSRYGHELATRAIANCLDP